MQQLGEMLSTSASQYINPDYYNPLPTTLDAKKSPLAMLAQTCSSIGKDPSTKSIIPPLEKKDAEKQQLEKSTPAENETKDSNTKESADTNDKPKFRSVVHKDVPALVPVSRSKEEKSATPTSKSSPKPKDVTITTASASSQSERASVSSRSPHSRHSVPDDHRRRPESPRSPRHVPRSIASDYDVSKAGQCASFSSYPYFSHPGLSADALAGYPYGLHSHAAAAALAAQSSALAAQSSALKSAYGNTMSPYVSYARVRTPSGATTLVPVCRDPYCTNCQLTVQNSHLSSTCTAVGCTQCAHEKALQNLSMGLPSFPHMPPTTYSTSSLMSAQGLGSHLFSSSLYPSLSAAHSGLPFVCNWVSPGNEPCGKRFTTSEDLLQHLRSHTTVTDPLALAAAYERYGVPPAGLPGFSHLGLPSPGSSSPGSIRRTYPTSLSPLSAMGSSRYHPYKTMTSPATAGLPSQQLPSFGPYFSPYSLYGQRIGAAAVP